MNVKEGLRRIGLVIAIAGACVGTLMAYEEFGSLGRHKDKHQTFIAWLQSPTVQNGTAEAKTEAARPAPPKKQQKVTSPYITQELWDTMHPDPDNQRHERAKSALAGHFEGWPIDKDGISSIRFYGSGSVYSIELANHESIQDEQLPTSFDYFALILYPAIGFSVPWGLFKLFAWIISGFTKT